jgi:hypothetical protein
MKQVRIKINFWGGELRRSGFQTGSLGSQVSLRKSKGGKLCLTRVLRH